MTESAEAQPTQDPVLFWSPIFHQAARRSLDEGRAALAASRPACTAFSIFQSFSTFREGMQFKIRSPYLFFLFLTMVILLSLNTYCVDLTVKSGTSFSCLRRDWKAGNGAQTELHRETEVQTGRYAFASRIH